LFATAQTIGIALRSMATRSAALPAPTLILKTPYKTSSGQGRSYRETNQYFAQRPIDSLRPKKEGLQ
jgi:hypothetical protein